MDKYSISKAILFIIFQFDCNLGLHAKTTKFYTEVVEN